MVARGFVVSALPSISVRRLSANLCPRARSGVFAHLRKKMDVIIKGRDECRKKSPGKPHRVLRVLALLYHARDRGLQLAAGVLCPYVKMLAASCQMESLTQW